MEAELSERVQYIENIQAASNEQQSRFDQALSDFQEERSSLIEEHSNLLSTKEADWQEQEASLRFQLDALKEHT